MPAFTQSQQPDAKLRSFGGLDAWRPGDTRGPSSSDKPRVSLAAGGPGPQSDPAVVSASWRGLGHRTVRVDQQGLRQPHSTCSSVASWAQ
ncbi:MAG: hypothetical protein QOI25_3310 [Mycobacterium sp.]|nr:hypothetical protein [Mycobacterium sp.]